MNNILLLLPVDIGVIIEPTEFRLFPVLERNGLILLLVWLIICNRGTAVSGSVVE